MHPLKLAWLKLRIRWALLRAGYLRVWFWKTRLRINGRVLLALDAWLHQVELFRQLDRSSGLALLRVVEALRRQFRLTAQERCELLGLAVRLTAPGAPGAPGAGLSGAGVIRQLYRWSRTRTLLHGRQAAA